MEKPTNNKSNGNNITTILQQSSLLQDYVCKTQNLEKLTQIIRQYLEPEMAKNCSVANLINNELILATTSSTWNHKLRFLVPDLLKELRTLPKLNSLVKIKIIQQPCSTINKYNTMNGNFLKKMHLSKSNAEHICVTAAHISDPELSKAMREMAQTIEANSTFHSEDK